MYSTHFFHTQLQVELSFTTGQIITIFGEMDEDGFYNAEIEGVRGLVPSNFLAEATDQFGPGGPGQVQTGRGGISYYHIFFFIFLSTLIYS